MTSTSISVGEAKSRFSELISRALSGERFVVRRRDKVVAAIIGPEDFGRLDKRRAKAIQMSRALGQREDILKQIEAGEVHPLMAAYGLFEDQPEWDDVVDLAYKNRKQSRKNKRPDVAL